MKRFAKTSFVVLVVASSIATHNHLASAFLTMIGFMLMLYVAPCLITVSNRKPLPARVFIPDILARWPYPRRINPRHDLVEKESAAWTESFGAFSSKAQHAFNCGHVSLLGSLAYPTANKGHLRAACDCVNLLLVIDELTDVSDQSEVKKQKDAVMDALRNPNKPRPEGEWVGGEMARQLLQLAIQNGMSKQCQKSFVRAVDGVMEGTLQQAIDKSRRQIRDIKSYFDVRRKTIGARAGFALLEWSLDIPDEVMSHPAIQEMVLATLDMFILSNDITSYNKEQSIGDDDHNIITIVMNQFRTNVNGAMLWAHDCHTRAEQKFHAGMAALPVLEEPLNLQVREYCDGLGNLVRANHVWHFEAGRYFGNRGREIMEKKWMSLMPKRKSGKNDAGPMLVESSLL